MTDTILATVKTQHTALPWELGRTIDAYIDIDAPDAPISWTALARVVVEVDGKRSDEGQANAAFIVRACNSHYQLVEALRDILEDAHPEAYPEARATLAALKDRPHG